MTSKRTGAPAAAPVTSNAFSQLLLAHSNTPATSNSFAPSSQQARASAHPSRSSSTTPPRPAATTTVVATPKKRKKRKAKNSDNDNSDDNSDEEFIPPSTARKKKKKQSKQITGSIPASYTTREEDDAKYVTDDPLSDVFIPFKKIQDKCPTIHLVWTEGLEIVRAPDQLYERVPKGEYSKQSYMVEWIYHCMCEARTSKQFSKPGVTLQQKFKVSQNDINEYLSDVRTYQLKTEHTPWLIYRYWARIIGRMVGIYLVVDTPRIVKEDAVSQKARILEIVNDLIKVIQPDRIVHHDTSNATTTTTTITVSEIKEQPQNMEIIVTTAEDTMESITAKIDELTVTKLNPLKTKQSELDDQMTQLKASMQKNEEQIKAHTDQYEKVIVPLKALVEKNIQGLSEQNMKLAEDQKAVTAKSNKLQKQKQLYNEKALIMCGAIKQQLNEIQHALKDSFLEEDVLNFIHNHSVDSDKFTHGLKQQYMKTEDEVVALTTKYNSLIKENQKNQNQRHHDENIIAAHNKKSEELNHEKSELQQSLSEMRESINKNNEDINQVEIELNKLNERKTALELPDFNDISLLEATPIFDVDDEIYTNYLGSGIKGYTITKLNFPSVELKSLDSGVTVHVEHVWTDLVGYGHTNHTNELLVSDKLFFWKPVNQFLRPVSPNNSIDNVHLVSTTGDHEHHGQTFGDLSPLVHQHFNVHHPDVLDLFRSQTEPVSLADYAQPMSYSEIEQRLKESLLTNERTQAKLEQMEREREQDRQNMQRDIDNMFKLMQELKKQKSV